MDPTLALAVDPLVGLPPLVSLSHGLLGLAVLTGLGLGVLRLTGALPRLTTLERLIVAYPLGWLPAYAAIMALGSLARLDQATLVPLLAFGALLAVPGWVLFIRTDCPANRGIDRPWTIGEYLLLAGLLTFGALSWIQALSPPNTYDSLMYHLTGPRYSVEAGTLAVPFDRVLAQLLFPQGIGHVTRLMLVLSSAEAVQLLIGALTFIAAGAIYALAARLSFSRSVGLWGAVLFLGLRVVAWQIAAAETDLPVTACTLAALLVWTIWRSGVALPSAKSMALAVLFGFLLGVGILFKLHGFVIAFILGLLLLADSVGKKVRLSAVLLAAVVAFLTILPHLIWAFWVTGNPIFPLFHDHIRPDALSVYEDVGALYGTGRGWADLWAVMVTLSLAPMHYFDGMVLGAPYLLALAPLGFLAGRARKLAPLALFAGGYGFIWFFLLSEQVRFLLPVLPVICLFAGLGLVSLWQGVKSAPALRAAFFALLVLFAGVQATFHAAYIALRLPSALGLQDRLVYLNRPGLGINFAAACRVIDQNLQPGERYYIDFTFTSFYCPQRNAIDRYFPDESDWWLTSSQEPAPLTGAAFARKLAVNKVTVLAIQKGLENRRNSTGARTVQAVDPEANRAHAFLQEHGAGHPVLYEDKFVTVYDVRLAGTSASGSDDSRHLSRQAGSAQ